MLVVTDVVLEKTLGTIVCEPLRQLDDSDEIRGRREVLADTTQGALLVVVGLLAIRRWDHLRILLIVLGRVRFRAGDESTGHILLVARHALAETLMEAGAM